VKILKYVSMSLFLVLSFSAASYAESSYELSPESISSIQRGREFYNQKRYRDALKEFSEISENESNFPKAHIAMGLIYEKLAEQEVLSSNRIKYYDKALEEFNKLPIKKAEYRRRFVQAKERIKPKITVHSNMKVTLGDTKEELVKYYGEPDHIKVSTKYFPRGIVSTYAYNTLGIRFKLKADVIYNIQLGSNFKGTLHGVRIGDKISKVKNIFDGSITEKKATSAVFVSNEMDTNFIYSLEDDEIDGIEQNSDEIFGTWDHVLK